MNKVVIVCVILLSIVFFGFIFISNKNIESKNSLPEKTLQQSFSTPEQVQPLESQASFAIFTNGTFREFGASMYHNLSSDVYIETNNPNIVKIRKAGITWDDFFKTLPFSLTKDCLITGTKETFCSGANNSLRFYLNGSLDKNALDKEINPGDQLLVTFGKEDEQQTQEQIQQLRNMIN